MKNIPLTTCLKYYKRKDIQEALLTAAENKEIAVVFGEKGYGKRPDILKYPNDILELVKQGATSFHCSEELWDNPLQLKPSLPKQDLDTLRIGWDLVLDIDCTWLEYSKIAAHVLVEAFQHHGIQTPSVKFSGNHGFHIALPFTAFPKIIYDKNTKDLFPEGPRKIAAYLKHLILERVQKGIMNLEKNNWENIKQKTGLTNKELKLPDNTLNVDAILTIDTVLISPRHLYRMPYSLNEKSGLASTPIKPEEILIFNRIWAQPENVTVYHPFLDETKTKPNEAKKLLIAAFDFTTPANPAKIELINPYAKEYDTPTTAVPTHYFPPCIQLILNGLSDGKKRSLFVLTNFLTSCGWTTDELEKFLYEWNQKNPEPLREVYLKGQLRYHTQHPKKVLPPNCSNAQYYQDLHICQPDNFCKRIKNPAQYARLKQRLVTRENEKPAKTRKNKNSTTPEY